MIPHHERLYPILQELINEVRIILEAQLVDWVVPAAERNNPTMDTMSAMYTVKVKEIYLDHAILNLHMEEVGE